MESMCVMQSQAFQVVHARDTAELAGVVSCSCLGCWTMGQVWSVKVYINYYLPGYILALH